MATTLTITPQVSNTVKVNGGSSTTIKITQGS